jgi:hypothetical protein
MIYLKRWQRSSIKAFSLRRVLSTNDGCRAAVIGVVLVTLCAHAYRIQWRAALPPHWNPYTLYTYRGAQASGGYVLAYHSSWPNYNATVLNATTGRIMYNISFLTHQGPRRAEEKSDGPSTEVDNADAQSLAPDVFLWTWDNGQEVRAYSLATGRMVWSNRHPANSVWWSGVYKGVALLLNYTNEVVALNATTGQRMWAVAFNKGASFDVAGIANDVLFLTPTAATGRTNLAVEAVDVLRGQHQWRRRMPYAESAYRGGVDRRAGSLVVVGVLTDNVTALDCTTGATLWQAPSRHHPGFWVDGQRLQGVIKTVCFEGGHRQASPAIHSWYCGQAGRTGVVERVDACVRSVRWVDRQRFSGGVHARWAAHKSRVGCDRHC